jgi:hypothetical protein
MLMLGLVIVIILRILSDQGFMRIQIGACRRGAPFF